jgi:hypothetical protein
MPMIGAVLGAVVVLTGVAWAQSPGSAPASAPGGLVPLTGPSATPAVAEVARPDVLVAAAPAPAAPASVSRAATGGRRVPPAVKVVHKPGRKATVRKATATRHVVKRPVTGQTRHVAAARPGPVRRQATVGKPIPLAKPKPPAKGAAPGPPVLPRV